MWLLHWLWLVAIICLDRMFSGNHETQSKLTLPLVIFGGQTPTRSFPITFYHLVLAHLLHLTFYHFATGFKGLLVKVLEAPGCLSPAGVPWGWPFRLLCSQLSRVKLCKEVNCKWKDGRLLTARWKNRKVRSWTLGRMGWSSFLYQAWLLIFIDLMNNRAPLAVWLY